MGLDGAVLVPQGLQQTSWPAESVHMPNALDASAVVTCHTGLHTAHTAEWHTAECGCKRAAPLPLAPQDTDSGKSHPDQLGS